MPVTPPTSTSSTTFSAESRKHDAAVQADKALVSYYSAPPSEATDKALSDSLQAASHDFAAAEKSVDPNISSDQVKRDLAASMVHVQREATAGVSQSVRDATTTAIGALYGRFNT